MMEQKVITTFLVSPQHQRQGIGTYLLQHCCHKADAAALPIYLTAFPNARSLYLSCGFKEVDHFDVDLNEDIDGTIRKYDGPSSNYRFSAMIRLPGRKDEGDEEEVEAC